MDFIFKRRIEQAFLSLENGRIFWLSSNIRAVNVEDSSAYIPLLIVLFSSSTMKNDQTVPP